MMGRRQRGGEVLDTPEIPLDLQIEIVNRLPIKSLARFKCVSKFWSSVIHSKGHLFAAPPRLFISLVHEPFKSVLLSLTPTSENTAFELDLKINGIGGYNMVALRGLILYRFCGQACIYNPTTGQRIGLPALNILGEEAYTWHVYYFFGYDPVLDQYKVVCTAVAWSGKLLGNKTHHYVFVLEARSSWKRIEFDHPQSRPHFAREGGLCINGVIYYFASRIIISFDVRYEEFNTIQLPSVVYEYDPGSSNLKLIEYDGKPTIFDYIHLRDPSGLLNLWVLEDAGIWSKQSLVLQPLQKHVARIYFEVIGTTQNGEVVLKPHHLSKHYYILYYDLHKNDVRWVDIRGIPELPVYLTLMDTGENIMHLKI